MHPTIFARRISLLVFLATIIVSTTVQGFAVIQKTTDRNVQYRQGQKRDEFKIAATLTKELMNPLGIQSDRFIVATTTTTPSDTIIGWAQIRPLGNPITTTTPTTAQRDPNRLDARPGSYDLDQEIDDAMWDDFDNDDTIQVPVGWASLPWTKEYRAMSKAVQDRDQRREALRAQRQEQLQPLQLYELASVYVEPAHRGRGIGTELVRRVLRQRIFKSGTTNRASLPTNIYCLTLATTTRWYQDNFGFEIVSSRDIPAPMALEVTAGNIITKLIGAQLCCMRGTSKTLDLCRQPSTV